MDCHIEIFHEDQWIEAAQISFSDVVQQGFRSNLCVFEYDLNHAFGEAPPPVSLAFPVDAMRHRMESWPAFLYDLVPQGNGRRFLLGRLQLPDTQASDLPLLLAGAFNPIGRLRIKEAVQYFDHHVERHALVTDGFELDELIARGPGFHETMMAHGMLAAGGTGVQGVAPKYLLTEGANGRWYPDAALPDPQARRHYIVKRPRGTTAADSKVLRNEARYLEVARRMGIRVGEPLQLHGDMLFIPRFDRVVQERKVLRLHQESLASIAGLVGFGVQANQFHLLAAIRRVVGSPIDETIEFIKRDVLNLAMRNTDNHSRNTAVQTIDGITHLTPLFDFAPMYLDPEGIVRAARWYHPTTRNELRQWEDILPLLGLPAHELQQLVEVLVCFGEQLQTLPDCMHELGIDVDIIDFLLPGVEAQRTQLLALR